MAKLVNNYNPYREPVWQSLFIAEVLLPTQLGNIDNKWLTIPCYSANLPSIALEQVEMHYISTKFYFASGQYNLDDLTLGFHNFNVGESSARTILTNWSMLEVDFNQGKRGYAGSKEGARDGYKTTINIYELNNDGTTVHTVWIFLGTWLKNTAGSNKSWENKTDTDKLEVPFRYDTFYRIPVETPVIGQDTWVANAEEITS